MYCRRSRLMFACAAMFATLFLSGCGAGTDYTGYSKGQEVPKTLTLEQIEYAKAHISDIRPGLERGEMWDQLRPMLGNVLPHLIDDSAPASNTAQSYDLGHGYILRLYFDPKNDVIYRRAEIVKR